MAQSPSSPPPSLPSQPTRKSSISKPNITTEAVPPTSHLRTTPIHPSIPSIKLPAEVKPTNTNPITLQPFTDTELKIYGFEKLRADFLLSSGNDGEVAAAAGGTGGLESSGFAGLDLEKLAMARDEAIRELRNRIEDRENKIKEIDREMDKKEKTREVERKVYRKKMKVSENMGGEDGDDGGNIVMGAGDGEKEIELEAEGDGGREVEMGE